MSKYLYHVDDVNVEDVIDGTLYVIQPSKIVEVKDDFHAQALLNHKVHQGLIEVTVTPKADGSGFDWTVGYKQAAADALGAADDARIQDWVTGQIEERIRKNYPALPPSDRLKVLIKRRGVVIENFGIRPVEIKQGQGQQPVVPTVDNINVTELIQQRNTLDAKLKQEQAERAADRETLAQLGRQVTELMKAQAQGKGTEENDKGDVDEGTSGEGQSQGAGEAGSVAEQGTYAAPVLQDITSRTVRRPNERKPTVK